MNGDSGQKRLRSPDIQRGRDGEMEMQNFEPCWLHSAINISSRIDPYRPKLQLVIF